MSPETITSIFVVAFASAIAGRLVDFSAVWFLFHPYKKIDLPLIRELGVLPRRQEALAEQVAKLIEDRLITREAIGEFLTSDSMAAKVRETVREAFRAILESEYPSVRDLLTSELGSALDIDREIRVFANWVGEQAGDLVSRPAFRSRVANFASEYLEARRDRPLGDLLLPGTFETIAGYLSGRWDHMADSADEMAAKLDEWAMGLGLITDYVPAETLEVVRARIKDRLPAWLQILEELIKEPRNRAAIKTYLLDVIDRLSKTSPNLFSVEGLLGAWMQFFPEDFGRRLEGFIEETVPRLRKALEDPANVEFIRSRIDLWVDEFKTTPLSSYYSRLSPHARAELKGMLALVLRSPNVRRSITWLIDTGLDRARATPLDRVLPVEVFVFDRVARRHGELAELAPDALCEFILPQVQDLVAPQKMPPIVEAATAKDRYLLATLLTEAMAGVPPEARRELDLYCHLLRQEAVQLVPEGGDWVARGVDALAASLADETAQKLIAAWVERGVEGLLGIPIGNPSKLIREDRIRQVEDVAVNQILALLRNHAHRIAQAIDLKDMVRQRILAADPAAIEEVVKNRLAKREFNTIFAIGLIFGSVVGLVTTGLFHTVARYAGWPGVVVAGLAVVGIMLRLVRV